MATKKFKRVFTLGFAASTSFTSPGANADDHVLLVAQEDYIIIGFQMTTKTNYIVRMEGEGMLDCDWVLTTSGRNTGGGVLGWLDMFEHQEEFTAGAGLTASNPSLAVMFPEGSGVPMREGETLMLKHSAHAIEYAGDVGMVCDGTVYYMKGSPATD